MKESFATNVFVCLSEREKEVEYVGVQACMEAPMQ